MRKEKTNIEPEYDGHLYDKFRIKYPIAVAKYLLSFCGGDKLAWDCCTGTGFLASLLSKHFEHVIASDRNIGQLNCAPQKNNIEYVLEDISFSRIKKNTVDLIAIGQAFHFLDKNTISEIASDILKLDGVLAVLSYKDSDNSVINDITNNFFSLIANDNDKQVEKKLSDIINGDLHINNFHKIEHAENFFYEKHLSIRDYIGYLSSISSAVRYKEQHNTDPINYFIDDIRKLWGKQHTIFVRWPININMFKRNG